MSSPFFDQGNTHRFSDWLIPSLFAYGVEDLDEYYVGAFPDLDSFLNRGSTEWELNRDVFENDVLHKRMQLARILKKVLKGRAWIDLGSGPRSSAVVPRIVAHEFNASLYIGVDLIHESDQIERENFGTGRSLEVQYRRADVLQFVKKFEFDGPLFFFISGLEFKEPSSEEAKAYQRELEDRILQLMRDDDYLLLGPGSPEFDWSTSGLKQVYSDYYHSLWRKPKSTWRRIRNLLKL